MKIKILMLILVGIAIFAAERPFVPESKGAAESALQEMKLQPQRYYAEQLSGELQAEVRKFYKDFTKIKEWVKEFATTPYITSKPLQIKLLGNILKKPEYNYLANEPELTLEILKTIQKEINPEYNIYNIAIDLNVPVITQWVKIQLDSGNKEARKALENQLITLARIRQPREDEQGDFERLLALGISTNAQNENGDTSLISAARSGNLDNIMYLLEAGADVHIINNAGQNALDVARDRFKTEKALGLHTYEPEEIINYLRDEMSKNPRQAFGQMREMPGRYYPSRLPAELKEEIYKYMEGPEKI